MSYSDLLRAVVANQVPQQFILDLHPDAAGAYSLRYLSSLFSGNVILVRRSSDDAEEAFTPTEITDGTLTTFCGAGDGFVKTWYDQSGNNNNATQSTAGAQPKIVDSGSLITLSGLPSVLGDGIDDFLLAPNISGVVTGDTEISNFNVVQGTGTGDVVSSSYYGFLQLSPLEFVIGNRRYFWLNSDSTSLTSVRLAGGNTLVSYNSRNPSILGAIYKGDQDFYDIYANGSLQTRTGGGAGAMNIQADSGILLFGLGGSGRGYANPINFHNSYISESILYFSDQTPNWQAIQDNQNAYYGIF